MILYFVVIIISLYFLFGPTNLTLPHPSSLEDLVTPYLVRLRQPLPVITYTKLNKTKIKIEPQNLKSKSHLTKLK